MRSSYHRGMLALLMAVVFAAPAARQDGDERPTDNEFRQRRGELETRLRAEETGLLLKAALPALPEAVLSGAFSPPGLIGEVADSFDDGETTLVTLRVLPWTDRRQPVYLDTRTRRRFVEVPRDERDSLKGLVLYAWLADASADRAVRAVFGTKKAYDAWAASSKQRIEEIRTEVAEAVEARRGKEMERLYAAAAVRVREREEERRRRLLIRELKARDLKGPSGELIGRDAGTRTLTVEFRLEGETVERSWPLAERSLVIVEGQNEASLSELGVGCYVTLWFGDPARSSLGLVEARGPHVGGYRGAAGTIDFERRTVTLPPGDDVEHPGTWPVEEEAWIEINGHRDSFDKLDPAKPFRVQLSADMKRVIALRQGRPPRDR